MDERTKSLKTKCGSKRVTKAVKKKNKIRVAQVVEEPRQLRQLRRNDRAIRSEMQDYYMAIGKRVANLHKRIRGESPLNRYKAILRDIEKVIRLEEEYKSNRENIQIAVHGPGTEGR
jgi:hypothetical protein